MASLELTGIVKRFGETTVIHDIDLQVKDGEFVVFVGPSGCGKSTLLRMIAGLESASAGNILIDGKRVNDVSAAQRGLAMVFQSYALYPHMTVYQNLAFGLENMRVARAEIDAKVQAAAKMLRLDALLERRPTQLSGGQRQRVAIGRAIVRDPTIFLFDEPLSNLDAELRVQMRTEIIALHRRLGTTMIYVTHDQVEAMTMADRIVVLRDGRAEQVGTPLDLYNHPANRFVAGFIGSPQMNFLTARTAAIGSGGARIVFDAAPDISLEAEPWISGSNMADAQRITVGIRPEHVVLGAASTEAVQMNVSVDQVEQLGAVTLLYCSLPNGERLTVHAPGQTHQEVGSSLQLSLPLTATHLFDGTAGEAALARR